MRKQLPLLGAGLALAITACSTVDVSTSRDPQVDLTQYHTFNFKHSAAPAAAGSLERADQALVEEAVARELEARGYALGGAPDLAISVYLRRVEGSYDKRAPSTGEGSVAYNLQKYYGFYYGYERSWAGKDRVDYQEGSLIIDLVDAGKQQLVWQGVAKGVLFQNRTPEQIAERIREAVRNIFQHFPE